MSKITKWIEPRYVCKDGCQLIRRCLLLSNVCICIGGEALQVTYHILSELVVGLMECQDQWSYIWAQMTESPFWSDLFLAYPEPYSLLCLFFLCSFSGILLYIWLSMLWHWFNTLLPPVLLLGKCQSMLHSNYICLNMICKFDACDLISSHCDFFKTWCLNSAKPSAVTF